jgi:mRNA interferase MazF
VVSTTTVLAQGQVWWAELPPPVGSVSRYGRPVLVVQGNAFNRSRIRTVVIVPLTSNLRRANDPGNVLLSSERTGLPQDSVANCSLIATIDRGMLDDLVGQLSERLIQRVMDGIGIVLGR